MYKYFTVPILYTLKKLLILLYTTMLRFITTPTTFIVVDSSMLQPKEHEWHLQSCSCVASGIPIFDVSDM